MIQNLSPGDKVRLTRDLCHMLKGAVIEVAKVTNGCDVGWSSTCCALKFKSSSACVSCASTWWHANIDFELVLVEIAMTPEEVESAKSLPSHEDVASFFGVKP